MQHLHSIRARYKALRLARQRLVKAFEAALWRRKGWEPGEILDARTGKREWIGTGPDRGKRRYQIIEPGTRKRKQPAQPAPSEQRREKTPVAKKRTIKPKVDSQQAALQNVLVAQAQQGRADLPDLYRQLTAQLPGLTQGDFQDALRSLADAGVITLVPYEGSRAAIADDPGLLFHDGDLIRTIVPGRGTQAPPPARPVVPLRKVADDILRRVAGRDIKEPVQLPDLYATLAQLTPGLTIGQFHDILRDMSQRGEIRLLPYTRAMAAIRGAREALVQDGEVLLYAVAGKGGQQKPASPAPDAATVYDATRQAWQELSSRALHLGGLVKIPDLYDAVAAYVPGLSQSDFHALLQRWQAEDRLGLQLCNTPHLEPRASEGIATPRGLLHYVVLSDRSPLRRKFEKQRGALPGDEPAAWQATQEAVERLRRASRHLGGTVKIPDLTDAVTQAVPGLAVEDFHRMLRQWHEEGRLLLQLCNDPRLEPRAREGIRSDRGLLHYVQLN